MPIKATADERPCLQTSLIAPSRRSRLLELLHQKRRLINRLSSAPSSRAAESVVTIRVRYNVRSLAKCVSASSTSVPCIYEPYCYKVSILETRQLVEERAKKRHLKSGSGSRSIRIYDTRKFELLTSACTSASHMKYDNTRTVRRSTKTALEGTPRTNIVRSTAFIIMNAYIIK